MKIPAQSQHFTPAQHMLLQMFANDMPEEDLQAIHHLLSEYLAKRATTAADKALEGKDVEAWTDEMLSTRLRAPKRSGA